jgi:hypothetical protein
MLHKGKIRDDEPVTDTANQQWLKQSNSLSGCFSKWFKPKKKKVVTQKSTIVKPFQK